MKKTILTILDGYGLSKNSEGNAVKLANTKTLDKIFQDYPNTTIKASGVDVGLPDKQMGNSEVGHMNIGAGRIIYQDLTKINHDIETKEFFANKVLKEAICYAKKNHKKVHLLGLLSDGGVHSHIKHLFAILDYCYQENFSDVFVHAILDGRDTLPTSGLTYLKELDEKLKSLKFPNIATVIGRFYTMDRDNRYERVQKGYSLMTKGEGLKTKNLLAYIEDLYYNKQTDEFIEPILVNSDGLVEQEDVIIFYNFRPDRAREITRAFVDKDFQGFVREYLNPYFVAMTEYDRMISNLHIIYPNEVIKNTIGEVVSKHNLTQLRIAETEKYAHVTFFLNGGVETKFPGEDRILIPSPKDVKTYDLKPEMSAYLVTEKVLEVLDRNYYDLIVLNFANPDMVGHTGNLKAAIKALEVIDSCMEKILTKVFNNDYAMIVTADHGNCEKMLNEDKTKNTAHTNNLVPLALINMGDVTLKSGRLADISPTLLDILEIKKPKEMTGESLINK